MEDASIRSRGAGDPADPLGALRHRWWLIVLAVLVGVAGGAGWLHTREPVWESTTSVLVHPAGHDTNVVGGRTQGEVNLDTEAQLVRSTAVAAGAAERLGRAPDGLAGRVRVEVPPNTSVLEITFAAATPERARAGSRAFAEAYLQRRQEAARADLDARMAAIEPKLEELDAALATLNQLLRASPPGAPVDADLESQREAVTGQLTAMTERLNELATATVSPGSIINEPLLPTEPSWPRPLLLLASGAALGLVAGVAAIAAAERLARRVRRPADVSRRLGIPVLATLTAATAPPPAGIAPPYGPAGRAFDRLRNEVTCDLAGQVVVVTGPTGGPATTLVAANLAASLARCGQEVVLVTAGSGTPAGAAVAVDRWLGVGPSPGLGEVLAGRLGAAEALQHAPRHARLRVLTRGTAAAASGLLQSPALPGALATLARQAAYVVVAAPPTTTSADAQSLASHAAAALLVLEPRRTRLAEAADAADQIRRVGTPVLGAVLLPPPGRSADPPEYPEEAPEPTGAAGSRPATVRPRPGGYPAGPAPAPVPESGADPGAQTLVMPRVGDDRSDPPDRDRTGRPAPDADAADPVTS